MKEIHGSMFLYESMYVYTTEQTPSANSDHKVHFKAPE